MWLVRLLAELKGEEASTVALKIDNQSAIVLSRNPVFHDHNKHIDIRYHFIHECVALGCEHFCEMRSRIGVVDEQSTH